MKILVVGDIHIAPTSSILKRRGSQFTMRLENCIKSIEWCENIAKEYGCEAEVFLGDTFDKPNLDQETITAVKNIAWNDITKYFIVGNHESEEADLKYSSVNILKADKRIIVNNPRTYMIEPNTKIHFIPYVTEVDRKPLNEYFDDLKDSSRHIIFSHNDIAGIQMGVVVSKSGFEIDDIVNNCDLFMNGHLHNGTWVVKNKIRNLGILVGQNFGEDASKYPHNVTILDTDTLECIDIENPYAFNFYNLSVQTDKDLMQFTKLKNNAVISVKCAKSLVDAVRQCIEVSTNIIESRVIIQQENLSDTPELAVQDLRVDHLQKLAEFCKEKIDNTEILNLELQEICK